MHKLSQNWQWLQALIIQWFILLFKFALSGHYSYFGFRQSTEINLQRLAMYQLNNLERFSSVYLLDFMRLSFGVNRRGQVRISSIITIPVFISTKICSDPLQIMLPCHT